MYITVTCGTALNCKKKSVNLEIVDTAVTPNLFNLVLDFYCLNMILFVGIQNPYTKLGNPWPCLFKAVLDRLFSILGIK